MAEIKSAIEIAMERTRGLRLSAEEKDKLKEEEFESRAHALVNRFLGVDLHFREVARDLEKYSSEQRARLEKIMIQDLAAALSLDRDNDLIFQGIDILAPEKKGVVPKVRELAEAYRREKEKVLRETGEIIRSRWQSLGVSGSAVVPKVAESPEYAEALKAFRPSYEARLQSLRDEIR